MVPGQESVLDVEEYWSLAAHSAAGAPPSDYLDWFDHAGTGFELVTDAWRALATGQPALATWREAILPLAAVTRLAPVPRPGKIICVGLNYRDHAAESQLPVPTSPVVFAKFPTAVVGPDEPIRLPPSSAHVDYEAELAVIIGRTARRIARDDALGVVLGVTAANDVSARDFQKQDGQWVRAKSCDTFAPMGPVIVTLDELAAPHAVPVRLRLNGAVMQDSNTDQFVFDIPALIEFLSAVMTLEPGDVILTGTPPGVGFARRPPVYLRHGDVVEVDIEGVGVLRNPVEALPDSRSAV
jgi:2-keto-4-pentenoate hydratase/2-oxohepta-3-ene-1,7-dioic acid hydratase in catechol pathway